MQGKDENPVKFYNKEFSDDKSSTSIREEQILKFWNDNTIFEKSLRKDSPLGNYVFYDGPPFATGLPHYGHILGSTVKDVVGRYQTMQGFRVPRRWGWDCHGLPIENIVEKELGISGRKAIEEYGLAKFTEYARSKVLTYVSEWKKTVDRIGRWVDFDNSYKTMDNSFIESVWWALGEMNQKDLLYEGVRVLAYCPRCETPIANSEIAMDNSYKDITDISVYVKFELVDEPGTYLIAWTTTPWSLPGDTAIAINKDILYLKVKEKETGNQYIFAKDVYEKMMAKVAGGLEIMSEFKGIELVGKKYAPPFDYYKDMVTEHSNIWQVWHADFVTADQGTGIAHEAPAFGEDDMILAKENNIPFIIHVTTDGKFKEEVADFAGIKVKPKEDHQSTDILIIKYLAAKNLLFAKEKIVHSYPHCYRCDTPLLYYALPSWFVNIQKSKDKMLSDAKSINWIPSHLKEGRFKNTMESAPDWTISRNRFWASPLPIWKSKNGEKIFIKSIEELRSKTKKSGNKYFVMRHGETNHNLENIVSVSFDNGDYLTDKGKAQVIESGENLVDENIDMIISSPFMRTRETTEILAPILNLKNDNVLYDDRLHEISIPMYEGKTWQEYHADYPLTGETFDEAPKGNESYLDVKKRIMSLMYDLEDKYQNKNILIVTHGGPAWLATSGARGYNAKESLDMVSGRKDFHYFRNAEYQELDFVPLPHNANYELDLHRPYIDKIVLVDDNGNEYTRIREVIDCWFESGSMPFAQDHYPFERPNWKKDNFPAKFIAEYIAQTRTWFYYTHAISSILFGEASFENVITTGTVLALDGQKMSKSKNNFPDPWTLFDKFGVDAIRFYLISSTLMKGEDLNFSEKGVQDIASKIISRLDNVVAFYELYKDVSLENGEAREASSVLNKWILTRLSELTKEVKSAMDSYDIATATRPFELFIEDLSTWYLRRSRERIKDKDEETKQTLYFVLKTLSKLLAPFVPFIAEDIWQKLKNDSDVESVHLSDWPESGKTDKDLVAYMEVVRGFCTIGNKLRKENNIPLRQPLSAFFVPTEVPEEYAQLICEELNVKNIKKDKTKEIHFDTHITSELRLEGQYRELVRALQDIRKAQGLNASDFISLSIETSVTGQEIINTYKSELLKTVGVKELKISENDGQEIKIDDLVFKVTIDKI